MAVVTAAASVATAQTGCPVSVKVDEVLAADTNKGMDTRLMTIAPQLNELFHYSTYSLLSSQDGKTTCGQTIAFPLPGGRILLIQPQGIEGNMIAMQLTLFQGQQPVMTTVLKLTNHGRLMVGGPHYEHGTLIISLNVNSGEAHATISQPVPVATTLSPGRQNAAAKDQPHQLAPSVSPRAP